MTSNRTNATINDSNPKQDTHVTGNTKNILIGMIKLQKLDEKLIKQRDLHISVALTIQDAIESHEISKLINDLNDDGKDGWNICQQNDQDDSELAGLNQQSAEVDLMFKDILAQIDRVNELKNKYAESLAKLSNVEKANISKIEAATGKKSQSKTLEKITQGAYSSLFQDVESQSDSKSIDINIIKSRIK